VSQHKTIDFFSSENALAGVDKFATIDAALRDAVYVGKAPLAVFPLFPVAALARHIGYSIEFMIHRSQHLDPFGRLYLTTEVWMYLLPLAAIFVGCFELMMREKAGISRLQSDQVGFDR
jgi:hypothetical protein